jgi:hypothetical protein
MEQEFNPWANAPTDAQHSIDVELQAAD